MPSGCARTPPTGSSSSASSPGCSTRFPHLQVVFAEVDCGLACPRTSVNSSTTASEAHGRPPEVQHRAAARRVHRREHVVHLHHRLVLASTTVAPSACHRCCGRVTTRTTRPDLAQLVAHRQCPPPPTCRPRRRRRSSPATPCASTAWSSKPAPRLTLRRRDGYERLMRSSNAPVAGKTLPGRASPLTKAPPSMAAQGRGAGPHHGGASGCSRRVDRRGVRRALVHDEVLVVPEHRQISSVLVVAEHEPASGQESRGTHISAAGSAHGRTSPGSRPPTPDPAS